MFEHDHSAARGEMAVRRLVAFKHASALGNAHAHALFDLVNVGRVVGDEIRPPGDPRLDNLPPARRFPDYRVEIASDRVPDSVQLINLV
jgi:CRISPR-associated protein Csd2